MSSQEQVVLNNRYELRRRIGRGGMAEVYLARDRELDRPVAVKILFAEFATDESFVARFRREAQSAANLNHPNIVGVYDWGKERGTYYIVMEYVDGRSLSEVVRAEGPLHPHRAAEVASDVASALGFAHRNDVVHRDIKPGNVLITSRGQVKVADFGIARAITASPDDALTQAGSVMGTATYFSPEQAQGAQPDPRSDLYSLGIVMYEMVAGRPPFTGENPVSIAYKQVHDAPQPLVQIVADVPRAYEAIVAKLLAKDPAMRYPTAGALRDDLRRFRSDQPVEALVAAQNAQGRAGAAAVAGAVAAATTVNPTAAPTTVGPSVPPRSATVPSTGMIEAGYPTGASADAMYYDTNQSKTGWYAIAAFLALIVLVVGGVLLFQVLSGNDSTDEPTQFILADYTNPPQLLADVTADLDSLGIRYETIAEESAVVPVGFVHRTDPVAGTVILADQTVKVYFNPDPQLVPVPGVVGLTLEAARLKLEGEGFKIGDITIEKTDEVAENTVISTDPAADTPALQGSTVAIVVAGPPDSVQVPGQVVGMTEIDARALLEAPPYQFTVTTAVQSSSTIPEGTVIEINPGPGALVLIGSDVTIVVSTGPQPVSVPSVTASSTQAWAASECLATLARHSAAAK